MLFPRGEKNITLQMENQIVINKKRKPTAGRYKNDVFQKYSSIRNNKRSTERIR
jgi:hypothetical protein